MARAFVRRGSAHDYGFVEGAVAPTAHLLHSNLATYWTDPIQVPWLQW